MSTPPDPRDDPELASALAVDLAAWINSLALAEAESQALILLAANGFPTDLTRPPTPAEVASRTSYAALEADVEETTTATVAALVAARAALLAATASVLAGAVTVAEVLRRLDLTVAGVLTIPGAFDVVTDLQRTLRRLLAALAVRAARRLIADAGRARVVPTDPRPVEDLLDVDAPASAVGQVLDVQASRLAGETASRAVIDLRDVAHRVAAATTPGAGVGAGVGGRADGPDVASRFVDVVVADTRDAAPSRRVVDSAHQSALAANGAGRTAAAAAYRRPSEGGGDGSGVAGGNGPTDPPNQPTGNGTGRPFDPNDPERDDTRTPDPTWQPEDGARFYASELLDRNTCAPCADVDGKEYSTYAAALLDYPLGQYRLCEGGTRCRGTLVMVSAREDPATLRTPGDGRGTPRA